MVPLSTLTRIEPRPGPEFTMRYNLYRCAQINGAAAPGYSSNQAMAALEEVFAETMPPEMGYDYLGLSFQEKKAQQGVPPAAIFGLSLLFVFLILAALYESWTLPLSVLLSTPVAVFGAFFVLWLRRTLLGLFNPPFMVQIESDIYSQIGLVMLIGLSAKNAILIVEFAKDAVEKGTPLVDAALEGARLRLRPILMTSFAFIFGCIPLWTASGAGSVARQIMGTTVIGGMLAASSIGIVFIPAMFYAVSRLAQQDAGARRWRWHAACGGGRMTDVKIPRVIVMAAMRDEPRDRDDGMHGRPELQEADGQRASGVSRTAGRWSACRRSGCRWGGRKRSRVAGRRAMVGRVPGRPAPGVDQDRAAEQLRSAPRRHADPSGPGRCRDHSRRSVSNGDRPGGRDECTAPRSRAGPPVETSSTRVGAGLDWELDFGESSGARPRRPGPTLPRRNGPGGRSCANCWPMWPAATPRCAPSTVSSRLPATRWRRGRTRSA